MHQAPNGRTPFRIGHPSLPQVKMRNRARGEHQQQPAFLQPSDRPPHGHHIAARRLRAAKWIDGDEKSTQFLNLRQNVIGQDTDVRPPLE